MSNVWIRREVLAVSRVIHQAAFAVASDGAVIMNVAHVGRRLSPDQLLEWALRERGALFIGLQLSTAEATHLLDWCKSQHEEGVARVIGKREQRIHRKNSVPARVTR
jgi:hypothetical protein